jgi:acyl carrier protein
MRAFAGDDAEPHISSTRQELAEIERGVVTVWSEVLDIDVVDSQDDFFDLGGDSVQMMQVVSRLRRRFGINLDLKIAFDGATPRGFAQAILDRLGSRAARK